MSSATDSSSVAANHHQSQYQQQQAAQKTRPERPLPPLAAITPLPHDSINSTEPAIAAAAAIAIQQQQTSDQSEHGSTAAVGGANAQSNGVYFDLCSPSSSSSQRSGSSHSSSQQRSPGGVSQHSDDGSHSPILDPVVAGRVLPLKLRHKSHLNDSRAEAAAAALLTLNEIKHEPEALDAEEMQMMRSERGRTPRRSTPAEESGDDRDSGVSSGDWTTSPTSSSSMSSRFIHHHHQQQQQQPATKRMRMSPQESQQQQQQQQSSMRHFSPRSNGIGNSRSHSHGSSSTSSVAAAAAEDNEGTAEPADERHSIGGNDSDENEELRLHVARLASELESLKTLMLGSAGGRSRGTNAANNHHHNNNNFRQLQHQQH